MTKEIFKEEYLFKNLYGLDKSNKIKEWTIKVINMTNFSYIIYTYGLLNGKKTECKITVSEGKNKGKRNETTHYQQAILDAKSKWNKKKDTDYITELNELQEKVKQEINNNDDNNVNNKEDIILKPMLAQEFKKYEHKVKYPCYIQPKLDGYRCIYNKESGKITTRQGKEYKIINECKKLCDELRKIKYSLDGELYVHDMLFKFEEYGVLRKQKNLDKKDLESLNKIEYHVYDIIIEDEPFENRYSILKKIINDNKFLKIKLVDTQKCMNKEDIDKYHKFYTENHYEGSIIRNLSGLYKCKYRSFDLLKYKDFEDGEFEIIDYTFEKDVTGNNKPLIVWICKTKENKQFNVQSKGTREERHELYKNAKIYIGKNLWVQYFGLTNDNIPRFPKTLREGKMSIRDEIL